MQQLFVYGSLRSGFNHPAFAYMSENFVFLGQARVKGVLYDMGEFPAALPATGDSYIHGELYQLRYDRDFDWVISQIDAYEGLDVEPGETSSYKREETTVFINDSTTTAWIYWYNRDVINSPVIASGDMMEFLRLKK